MTEYWVSQGNKWCEWCKIFISSNPSSIRNHELGTRHKDAVSQRLNNMRQEKAANDKQHKEAARVFQQIEAKAQRSYDKDLATSRDLKDSTPTIPGDWEYQTSSGYYYNQSNGSYFDPNSGFYYTHSLGKWVTPEEALVAVPSETMQKKPILKKPLVSEAGSASESKVSSSSQSGPAPGPVVSTSLNPARSVKGAPSSLAVNKRKRQEGKPKPYLEETALKG
ncbi:hypothetical protein Leryth_017042 [Lithospermum erythrorhizon]|nr:hypothetical protein Leryth_017042 [Lithospermum erythrorhizon]